MTREEFLSKYTDEMLGLLLSGFHEQERSADVEKQSAGMADSLRGKFMREQMRRAKDILGRMYADLNGKEKTR